MSTFGTGGLFVCAVVGAIVAIFTGGWQAAVGLGVIVWGYFVLLGAANDTVYPDGRLRPRRRRRRRRYR